jgi:hypothetical protein
MNELGGNTLYCAHTEKIALILIDFCFLVHMLLIKDYSSVLNVYS